MHYEKKIILVCIIGCFTSLGHQISCLLLVVEGKAHSLKMVIELIAQVVCHALPHASDTLVGQIITPRKEQ